MLDRLAEPRRVDALRVGSVQTAYFCEHPLQIQEVGASQSPGTACQVVTLTPQAWWAAQTRGVAALTLEELYDESELCELRYPVLQQQRELRSWIDDTLYARVPSFEEHRFRPAGIWFKWFKMLLDPLVILSFTLDEALARMQPREIAFTPRRRAFEWDLFFRIGPHGHKVVKPRFLPSDVLPLLAASRGIECRPLAAPQSEHQGIVAQQQVRTRIKRIVPWRLVDFINLHRGLPWTEAAVLWAKRRIARGPKVLVVRSGYDIDALTREAIRRGWRPEYWTDAVRRAELGPREQEECRRVRQQCEDLWPEIERAAAFREGFLTRGIDVFPLVREGMQHFLCDVVPRTFQHSLEVRAALAAGGHKVVLTNSAHSAPTVLDAARRAGVPVIVYQHGGFGATCEHVFWDFELTHSDCMLVYGDGVREYLEHRTRLHGERVGQVAVAGSARLQNLFRRIDVAQIAALRAQLLKNGRKRVIVYTSPITEGFGRLLAGDSYPETASARFHSRLFDLLREFPESQLVFKAYSGQDIGLVREMLVSKGISNCRIETRSSLPVLMSASDAIVVGFPSTPLLEAVLTSKPVVVYIDSRSLRAVETSVALLRRRARVAETEDDFLQGIRQVLAGEQGTEDLNDTAYAEAHVCNPAVDAVSRAWDHVSRMAGRS